MIVLIQTLLIIIYIYKDTIYVCPPFCMLPHLSQGKLQLQVEGYTQFTGEVNGKIFTDGTQLVVSWFTKQSSFSLSFRNLLVFLRINNGIYVKTEMTLF